MSVHTCVRVSECEFVCVCVCVCVCTCMCESECVCVCARALRTYIELTYLGSLVPRLPALFNAQVSLM